MSDESKVREAPNPFNPAALRIDPSIMENVGAKKLVTTIRVEKPNNHDYVRVNKRPDYRISAAIIELKEDREVYLVTPEMARELSGEWAAATLFLTINRQGVLRLWPVKLPGPDGKHNEWGNLFAPWVTDPGGIPYGDPLKGMEVVARELRRAHREAAALRKAKLKA